MQEALGKARQALEDMPDASAQAFSSLKRHGVDVLAQRLDGWLGDHPASADLSSVSLVPVVTDPDVDD